MTPNVIGASTKRTWWHMADGNEDAGADDLSFSAEELTLRDEMRRGASQEPQDGDGGETRASAAEAEKPAVEPGKEPERADKPKDPLHQAMHEEREKRKALAKELQDERVARARLEERTNLILQSMQGQPKAAEPEAPKMPDVDEDVFGAVKHLQQQVQQSEAEKQERAKAHEQQVAQQRERQQVIHWTEVAQQQFAQQQPDYMDAVGHLRHSRAAELRTWKVPEHEIVQRIDQEGYEIAAAALRQRRNPAEVAYQIALQRGYRPKAPEPANDAGSAAAQPDLDRVEAGQGASKSLSNGGAKSGGAEIDAKALAAMSEEDFTAFRAANPRKFDQLMGRAH